MERSTPSTVHRRAGLPLPAGPEAAVFTDWRPALPRGLLADP